MVQKGSFIHRTGVVVKTSCNGQIHRKVLLRHTKCRQIGGDRLQLLQTQIKNFVSAGVAFQSSQNLSICAGNGDKLQDLLRLLAGQTAVLHQDNANLVRADLVQLVHGAHDLAALFAELLHGVEAVEDLAVIYPDLEPVQTEAPEHPVDNGGNLRLVEDVQLAVTDDVDVRLIKFTEATPLGALTPIDLADLIAAEGESQLIAVQRHILGKGHCQIEPQRQIAVAFLEAVDLLLGLAAALCQKDLGILDSRGVQRRKAVHGVGLAQDFHHALQLLLLLGQQLHKTGQRPGSDSFHSKNLSSW